VIIKFFYFCQSCFYFCQLQKLKFINFLNNKDSINDNEDSINDIEIEKFVYKDLNFFVPKNNNYNYEKFRKLDNFFINFFNKHSYPEVFIDIGAFVGLYTFIVNNIYSNKKKKVVL